MLYAECPSEELSRVVVLVSRPIEGDTVNRLMVREARGHRRRLRDGWRVKLVDEDTRWYLSASRTKLR
jgi:hypothetical protein